MDPSNSSSFLCVCPPHVLGELCQYTAYASKSSSWWQYQESGSCDAVTLDLCVYVKKAYKEGCYFLGSLLVRVLLVVRILLSYLSSNLTSSLGRRERVRPVFYISEGSWT